jgi:hypothetical protein
MRHGEAADLGGRGEIHERKVRKTVAADVTGSYSAKMGADGVRRCVLI